jgi:hypothetical protein
VLGVPHLTLRGRRGPLRRVTRRPPAPAAVPRDGARCRRHPVRRARDALGAARRAQPEPRRGLPLRPAVPVGGVPRRRGGEGSGPHRRAAVPDAQDHDARAVPGRGGGGGRRLARDGARRGGRRRRHGGDDGEGAVQDPGAAGVLGEPALAPAARQLRCGRGARRPAAPGVPAETVQPKLLLATGDKK